MSALKTEPMDRRADPRPNQDALPLLYQAVLTGIVRVQSGKQRLSDPTTFRRRIKEALQDAQKEASAAGYSTRAIRDAESAVVAFLDEAVLSLKDPVRDAWSNQTLSVELYGESNAGEVFFERLEELRGQTDSQPLSDVLEVYLLCLLLGFEGRYSGPLRAQAASIADRLRSRIEGMRSTTDYRFSPRFRFVEDASPVVPPPLNDDRWKWWLIGAAVTPPILFALYSLNLSMLIAEFRTMISVVR